MSVLRVITNNFGWKLFSLAVAVLLWILVASEPELSTFRAVPVEYKDLPEELQISSSTVESVYLELHGPSGDLRKYGESERFAVVLDMTHVHSGVQTFTIDRSNVVIPRGLRLIRAVPAQLRFTFEAVRTRSLPVEVHFSHDPQPGYRVAGYTVSPPALNVSGPETQLRHLRSAVTDPIDLSSVVGTAEFRVHTFVDDPHVRFLTSSEVVVRVTVKRIEKDQKPPPPR